MNAPSALATAPTLQDTIANRPQLISEGSSKLASVPSGGAGGAAPAAGGAAAGGAAEAPKEEAKAEGKLTPESVWYATR